MGQLIGSILFPLNGSIRKVLKLTAAHLALWHFVCVMQEAFQRVRA